MSRWICGLAIALALTGCNGSDKAADNLPSEADVKAGNTKDSADPRLNALQHTKRKIGQIESEHKNAVDGAGEGQAP